MIIHQDRQDSKVNREAYREAARRLLDMMHGMYATVPTHANVTEDADKTGAFVECVIWVPKENV